MPNGVTFDGLHSYNNFGLWLVKRPEIGSPKPKTNTVEVPGADGILDLTEANSGEVKFTNRDLRFTFAAMVEISAQENFKSAIRNALHGRYVRQIILDEDADYYYSGRCSVSFARLMSWRLQCVVTVDAAPYAMRTEETVVDLNPPETPSIQRVLIAVDNAVQGDLGSELELGTSLFPSGVDTTRGDLIVSWPFGTYYEDGDNYVQVWSVSNGYTQTAVFRVDNPSLLQLRLTGQMLDDAGIYESGVYRIRVNGVKDCVLHQEIRSLRIVIQNGRKTVIPIISLQAQRNVAVTVNGKSYDLVPGSYVSQDIILRSGENDVYVLQSQSSNITSFTMTFREGKL